MSAFCPACGKDQVEVVQEHAEVRVHDGTVLKYSDEHFLCKDCGEGFYNRDQSLASSRARAGALRVHEGLLTPDQIRSLRQCYGLTQTDLETLVGVSAKNVVRWEKGTVRQSRAADRLMRLMSEDLSIVSRLAERYGVTVDVGIQTIQTMAFTAVAITDTSLEPINFPVSEVDVPIVFDLQATPLKRYSFVRSVRKPTPKLQTKAKNRISKSAFKAIA